MQVGRLQKTLTKLLVSQVDVDHIMAGPSAQTIL